MEEKISKIWKDPVLSKVISAGIIAAIIFAYNFVTSKINNESFQHTIKSFWENESELWKIALTCLIIIVIIQKARKNRNIKEINSFDGLNMENLESYLAQEIYDEESKILDSKLLNEIRNELLPTEQEISWLREQNFSYGFNREVAFKFFDFEVKISDNPNYEFLNPELEKLKKQLVKNIQIFNRDLSQLTFPDGNLMQSVPREWKKTNPKKLENSINILNRSKINVIEKYDELIRKGRRTLKI